MKLPNGYGTVYKLSGRRRNPWVARVTTGWTTATATKGKRKGQKVRRQLYQTIGYYETKQDALAALGQHHITPVAPKKEITLKQLYDEWSEPKYKKLSRYTVSNYKTAWGYIKIFEQEKFAEMRTAHWQRIIDLAAEKGLKKSALKKIRTVGSLLCKHAMKNDIVNKNYAALVELPKFEEVEKERFSDLEVKKLEEAAKSDRWVSVILIMVYIGFRISELMELTRFSVDLERQTVTGGMKTEAGKGRIVPIHPKILKYVKAWCDRGGKSLICKDDGCKMSADYFRKNHYYQALEAAGVRRLVPHATRHTFCSMLAEAGVDPLYIKELAGHTQYSFTADKYTHPQIKELKDAISKL